MNESFWLSAIGFWLRFMDKLSATFIICNDYFMHSSCCECATDGCNGQVFFECKLFFYHIFGVVR